MDKFGKSQAVTRVEDVRFLKGNGQYIADILPQGTLHCFVLRSQVAHGHITLLDTSDAETVPGVHLVVTAADLIKAGVSNRIDANLVKNIDGTTGAAPIRPVLATDRVRFVGEPVAVIVAETIEMARDAAELIVLDIDDLPVKLDLCAGGETIHPEAPG